MKHSELWYQTTWISLSGMSVSPPPLKACSAPPHHSPNTPTPGLTLKNTTRPGRSSHGPGLCQPPAGSGLSQDLGQEDEMIPSWKNNCVCWAGWEHRKSSRLRVCPAFVSFCVLTQIPFVSITETQTHTHSKHGNSSAEYEIR